MQIHEEVYILGWVLLPYLKEPLESVVCVLVQSVALTTMSLKLILRRKGIELKTFRHKVVMGG